VDLGGTKIACALARADGTLVAERTVPTLSHEGPRAVVERVAVAINALADELNERPLALGMGVPGLADLEAGTTRFLPNLPGNWRHVPVAEWLQPLVRCPVRLLNDVRVATLGELVFGHGRTSPSFVFFAVGTGIGGGIALEGSLYLGGGGANAEFGHTTVLPDGPRCGCGNRGCLETLASGPALTAEGVRLLLTGQTVVLHRITGGNPACVSPATLAQAAAEGESAARDIIVRCAEYLGIGIANVVSVLHPPLVVLGGGVAEIGSLLFDTVRTTVSRRVGMFPVDDLRIEPSQLGNRAGMLGGIALAQALGIRRHGRVPATGSLLEEGSVCQNQPM
jgi:glucokinase